MFIIYIIIEAFWAVEIAIDKIERQMKPLREQRKDMIDDASQAISAQVLLNEISRWWEFQ